MKEMSTGEKAHQSPALARLRHMKFENFSAYPGHIGSNIRRMIEVGQYSNGRAKDEACELCELRQPHYSNSCTLNFSSHIGHLRASTSTNENH
jgi:hypothetical protein